MMSCVFDLQCTFVIYVFTYLMYSVTNLASWLQETNNVFTARRYASVVLAVVMCLCGCLSVCLSVCHKPVLYQNRWTDGAHFWYGGFYRLNIIIIKEIRLSPKIRLWNFVPNSGLRKFRHVASIDATCCQLVGQRQTFTAINKRLSLVVRWTTFDRRRWTVYHTNRPPM